VTLAEQKLKVAQTQLEAAKDKASAVLARAQADADVVRFDNAAEAAGVAAQVSAFGGDGGALARNLLLGKLAPAFRTILGNSEGPLMDLFREFTQHSSGKAEGGGLKAEGETHHPNVSRRSSAISEAFPKEEESHP